MLYLFFTYLNFSSLFAQLFWYVTCSFKCPSAYVISYLVAGQFTARSADFSENVYVTRTLVSRALIPSARWLWLLYSELISGSHFIWKRILIRERFQCVRKALFCIQFKVYVVYLCVCVCVCVCVWISYVFIINARARCNTYICTRVYSSVTGQSTVASRSALVQQHKC